MNKDLTYLYDKNNGIKDVNDLIQLKFKDYIFYNIIIELNDKTKHFLDIIKKAETNTIYRVSIFTKFLENEYKSKINKLNKQNIYTTINILNNKHNLKNIFEESLLYFEKVVIINDYNTNVFSNVLWASDFVKIPFYYKYKTEYDDKIDLNKVLKTNYNFPKKFSIIENKLFNIKAYEKLIELLDEREKTCASYIEYSTITIKKITCYILLGKEDQINKNILNILNCINNIKLLQTIYLLINNTDFNEIKKNIIVKILLALPENSNEYNIYLISSLQMEQSVENLKIIFDSIIKNSKEIKDKINKENFITLLINQLIINQNDTELIERFNIISNEIFESIDIKNFDSILEFQQNNSDNYYIIINFLLLLATKFDLFYKSFDEFIIKRKQIETNLIYLKDKFNGINISLDQLVMFNVGNFNLSYQGKNNVNIFKLKSEINRKICSELNGIKYPIIKNNKIKVLFHGSQLTRKHSVFKDRHLIIKGLSEDNKFDVYFSTFDDLSIEVKYSFGLAKHIKLSRKLSEIKSKILEKRFDIIVYCEIGMDPTSYYMAHMRLANVQINTWGHSDTSGIDTIDYFISSKLYELSYEESQKHYSEKLILQESLCTVYENPLTQYNINNFKNRYYFGITNDTVIYFCGQSLFKFNPIFDDYVIEILEKVPNSIIILLDSSDKHKFIERFENKNIVSRFKFFPLMSHFDYLNLINISDVILDIYPFGGCNSSLECFSLGKVIVTQPSNMINGRFTNGFYKKMKLENLICNNKKEYIEFAIRLGKDKKYRKELEETINKKNNLLFNDVDSLIEWKNQLIKLIFND